MPTQHDLVLSNLSVETLAERVSEPASAALLRALPEAVRRSRLGLFLNDRQAQEETGLTRRQLRYLREQRRIEYRLVGRTVLYPTQGLFALIDAGKVAAHPTT